MSALSIEQLLSMKNLPENTAYHFLEILKGGFDSNRLLNKLADEEKENLNQIINEWLDIWFRRQLEMQKLSARLSGASVKEATYEYNHKNIHSYVREFVKSKGTVPSAKTIADDLKINRATVTKHLADSKNTTSKLYDDYQIIAHDVVGMVARAALRNDDVKAAKVYMDIMHKLKKDQPVPTHVQVDDFVITQPMLDKLTAAQKNSIKELLKSEEDIEEADVQLAEEVNEETPAAPEEKKVDYTINETAQQPILNSTEKIKEGVVQEGKWIGGVLHKTTKQPIVSKEEKAKERVPEERKEDTTKYKDRNGPTLFG
ncbi:MAG TPA: hypothetical protein VK174_11970 [Chitinophagales bacterium]|nr:hypothetical protein [Chitinophagales bacterium]